MANSSRMVWPIPSEGIDPWYAAFVDLIESIDSSVYGSREDRNFVLFGGGTIKFNAGADTLQWTSDITLLSGVRGFYETIAAATVTITDGKILYVQLVRSPTGSVTLTPVVGDRAPGGIENPDNTYVLAVRSGTKIHWRTGSTTDTGVDGTLNPGSGPPPTPPVLPSFIPVEVALPITFPNVATADGDVVESAYYLSTARLTIPEAIGTGFSILATGMVSGGGLTGEVDILLNGALQMTLVFTNFASFTEKIAIVSLSTGMITIKARLLGGAGPTDLFLLRGTSIHIVNVMHV